LPGATPNPFDNSFFYGFAPVDSLTPLGEKECVQTLVAAFKYLTLWHFFASGQPAPEILGRAALYFPAVGLVLGLTLALTNYVCDPYLHSEILSVALVALLLVATGGLHLEGLNETFAGFAAYPSWGIAAIALVLLFKSAAAESMDERLTLSLLLTPVLARWALVIFLYGDHTQFDGISSLIAEQITLTRLFAGTVATLALITYFLGRRGLWIALVVSLFALMARRMLQRRERVLTQANAGAVVELEEALSLILLATL